MKYIFSILFLFLFLFGHSQMTGMISVNEMTKIYNMNQGQFSAFLNQKGYKKTSSEIRTFGGDTSRFKVITFNGKSGKKNIWIEIEIPLNVNDSNKKQIQISLSTKDFEVAEEFYTVFLAKLNLANYKKTSEVKSPAVANFWETFQKNSWCFFSENRNCCGIPVVYNRVFTLTKNQNCI